MSKIKLVAMQLASGAVMDLRNFSNAKINMEDIAHSLAYQCRFNGGTKDFYSVAQHSILVHELAEPYGREMQLAALLHDAGEAFIGDIITPIKHACPFISELEDALITEIYKRYNIKLTAEQKDIIKQLDHEVLKREVVQLTNYNRGYWLQHFNFDCVMVKAQYKDQPCITAWSPYTAKVGFMQCFNQLFMEHMVQKI